MPKNLSFLSVGILFGVVMTKSEAISWYRIQEMFLFHSIHMYGIIGVAVVLGILLHQLIKRRKLNSFFGVPITIKAKPETYKASIIGGTLFGFGWAMTGACPGPLYVLLGHGAFVIIIVIISALFGTYVYGIIRDRLPH